MKKILFAAAGVTACLVPLSMTVAQPEDLVVTAVGDTMLGSSPQVGAQLLKPAESVLKLGDVVQGNFEGVFLDRGCEPKPHVPGVSYYLFQSPEAMADVLANAGFNLGGAANNHVIDCGAAGEAGTMRALGQARIAYSGLREKKPELWDSITKKGKSIGFLAFAFEQATPDIRDLTAAASLVKELKAKFDIVIIGYHGGGEPGDAGRGVVNSQQAIEHVTRHEEYYEEGEERDRGNVYAFAHAVIAAGADLVLGTSPHVPRALELVKSPRDGKPRLVAYSLGNFATYQHFSLSGETELSPILEVHLDLNSGAFTGGRIHAFKQVPPGGPKPDPTLAVISRMRLLSREDFPESRLVIDTDGQLH